MRIGFFDSGIGGITVLHEALREMPDEDYIYYADTDNAPYGIKTREEVTRLVLDAVDFIVAREVKAVVIACNTATSVAIEKLRDRYTIPIVGMEPAIKPAVKKNKKEHKRVIVAATPLTLKEDKCRNLIARFDNEHVVDLLPLPELVRFAENFEFDEQKVLPVLETALGNYNLEMYGTVVLGCTHFPFYRQVFRKLLPPGVDIIDGNHGTIRNLRHILEQKGLRGNGSGDVIYYSSGRPVSINEDIERFNSLYKMLDKVEK